MSKLFRAVILVAAIGAVMAAGNLTTVAPAQEKKKGAAKAEVGVAEVYKAKDGWRLRIKNPEGKVIAMSPVGLDEKEAVLRNLDIVKATLNNDKVEVLKEVKK
jgi:uncharacterized protein YegP (UPF0339 family)